MVNLPHYENAFRQALSTARQNFWSPVASPLRLFRSKVPPWLLDVIGFVMPEIERCPY